MYTQVPNTGRDLRKGGGGKRREGSCPEFRRGEENDHNFFEDEDVIPLKRGMEEQLRRKEEKKKKGREGNRGKTLYRGGGANSRPLKFPRAFTFFPASGETTYPTPSSFRSRCTYAARAFSLFPIFLFLFSHSLRTLVCLSDRFALRRVRSTLSGELRRGREAAAAGQPVVRREPGIGILDPEQPGAADHPRDNRLRSAYRLASRNNHDPHHVAIAPRRTHRPRVSSGGRAVARPSPPPQDGDRDRESPGVVDTSPSSSATSASASSSAAAILVEDRLA